MGVYMGVYVSIYVSRRKRVGIGIGFSSHVD